MNTRTYTLCQHCDHFVDVNDCHKPGDNIAPYEHLEDGEQEFNHDARPSKQTHTLAEWQAKRPDLFKEYNDGAIGPNSIYHSRRGKIDHAETGVVE